MVLLEQCLFGTCWKKILSAFPLPSALLGTENFFPFYVLPEEGGERERGGERGRERERGGKRGKRRIELLRFCRSREKNEILRHAHAGFGGTLNCASFFNCASARGSFAHDLNCARLNCANYYIMGRLNSREFNSHTHESAATYIQYSVFTTCNGAPTAARPPPNSK